jgi:uncharacterized protein YjbI with pentapeptide repeats
MAFPVIEATASTDGSSAATSHAVTLPATVSANALLIVVGRVTVAGAVAVTGGGWTIVQNSADASDDVTFWMYRDALAAGTEDGSTITVTHGNGKLAAVSLSITGAEPPSNQAPQTSAVADGASTTPNPTTCTPTGGAKDYLWIWAGGWEGEQTSPPASNPTNYTLNKTGANTGTGGVTSTNSRVAVAARNLNAASEDPGSWTISVSDDWAAWTIAVHPSPPPPTATSVGRISLAAGTNPASRTLHAIKVRARKTGGTGTVTLSAALYEGATNRSGDLTTPALTTDFVEYALTIPDANAANITSYADLEIRFWGDSPTSDTTGVEIAELALEVPSATFAGTVASTSSVTGALAVRANLTGAVVSASAVAGAGVARAGLSGTIGSASTVSGAVDKQVPLAGTIASASSVSGTISAPAPAAGVIASASAVSGNLVVRGAVAGTVASVSTVTGSVVVDRPLAGTVASVSTVSGALAVTAALAGSAVPGTTVTGSLTVGVSGADLSGTVAASSTLTGSLAVGAPLSGTIGSASTVTGLLTGTAGLSGAVSSGSTTAGSLAIGSPLTGTAASTSTLAGAVTVVRDLAGAVGSVSSVAGTLTNTPAGAKPVAGVVASTTTVSGSLHVIRPLTGVMTAESVVSGTLLVPIDVAGALGSDSTLTGAVVVSHRLRGLLAATSQMAGHAVLDQSLSGSMAAVSSMTGNLQPAATRWNVDSTDRWDVDPAGRWEMAI